MSVDALTRDRVLRLSGLELRGQPHPGQRYRHGWIPVSGFNLLGKAMTQEEIEASYGDGYENDEFSPGAHVEVSDRGEIHIDLAGEQPDTYHVFAGMDQAAADTMSEDLWWALNRADGDGGHRPPDPANGLTDWMDRDGVIVGYTPDGDIRIGWPAGENEVDVLDLPQDEAKALARKLREFADLDFESDDEVSE